MNKEIIMGNSYKAREKLKNAYNSFYEAFNVNNYYLDLKREFKIKKYLKKIGELL